MASEIPPTSYGATGAEPPVLPVTSFDISLIFEWAALLPVAIYLASSRLPHQLVGQTALAGYIPIALFPRIGVLGTITDFLHQGQEFLDRASSVNDLRRTVWDVNWGSVFPCANGAVAAIIGAHVLRDVKVQMVPEEVDMVEKQTGFEPQDSPQPKSPIGGCALIKKSDTSFRRYQKLHILRFSESTGRNRRTNRRLSSVGGLPIIFEVLVLVGLLGASIVCFLFGLYGAGTALVIAILFRISRQLIRIERPKGYLCNNEGSLPGCMLVSLHENASSWYLYIGSRGVIDTMLNKTMIQNIDSPLGNWQAHGLQILAGLQLAVMTYVAAQKGWDGIALLALVVFAWVFDLVVYTDGRIAALWLRREGVQVEAMTLQFSGRASMIGTIQVLGNQKVTSWMDGILAPSNRRNAWLRRLAYQDLEPEIEQSLTENDKTWIDRNERLTRMAESMIPPEFRIGTSLKKVFKPAELVV